MSLKIVASIEARMSSSRFPGKVLKNCVNKSLLELLIERVKKSKLIDEVYIATTTNPKDDEIIKLAKKLNVGYYKGSEDNVVKRVVEAMQKAHADIVIHLTGDNPLIDPKIIDQLIRIFLCNHFDYVSNMLIRSYPLGLDTQVTSFKILKDKPQHEHVCLSIYENPSIFKLFNLIAPPELCRPDLRLTMDAKEDYELIKNIFENLYFKNSNFLTRDVIEFLNSNSALVLINKNIKQKKVR